MTSGGAEPVFIDTNVLVYANVTTAPLHREALEAIRGREQAGVELWISRQVLREYLATLSRPQTFTAPLPSTMLTAQVRLFEARFRVAEEGAGVTANLLMLLEQIPVGGGQVHDANIVATMQVHGLPRLLTANAADFARFGHLIAVVPLV
jgi:predicted nucleic acid-binding protein